MREFTPSVRLPNNFIHQIGPDMILNESFEVVKNPEIFKVSDSIPKKMVFPQSSEDHSGDTEAIMNTKFNTQSKENVKDNSVEELG